MKRHSCGGAFFISEVACGDRCGAADARVGGSVGGPPGLPPVGLTCAVKGPGYPLVRPILPSLWPMPPSLWAMAPPRVDRTRAHYTYPPHQGLTPATQQDLSPSHAPRRTPFAARRPMVAARCSLPVARCPSLRVRRCHDPRVGGQRLYINPVILRAGLGMFAWAPLLVVVTRSCAAGPYWWQCGRPAWATTCGVNLRSEGAQVSTCPADPAVPVADAAIPVGDGATPALIASVNGRG